MWTDAHIHLTDSRWVNLDQKLGEWNQSGIQKFCLAGVSPEDWDKQDLLSLQHPNQFWKSFGLHPEWVSTQTHDDVQTGLDILARKVHFCHAIGETGLDWREKYQNSQGLQIEAFEAKLEIANLAKKPVVLHVVHAFHEIQKIWKWKQGPKWGGLVHSFGGGLEEANYYLKYGLHLSLGTKILKNPSKAFLEMVKVIPIEALLIESDAPDQSVTEHLGESTVILNIAQRVSEIRGLKPELVLDKTSTNAHQLLGEINP